MRRGSPSTHIMITKMEKNDESESGITTVSTLFQQYFCTHFIQSSSAVSYIKVCLRRVGILFGRGSRVSSACFIKNHKRYSLKKVSDENRYRYILYVSSVTFKSVEFGKSISDITCRLNPFSIDMTLNVNVSLYQKLGSGKASKCLDVSMIAVQVGSVDLQL